MACVGTWIADGIFGRLSITFFCCANKMLVLKVWANFPPFLKSLLFPLHFPSMDSSHHCVDGVALMAMFQNPVTSVSQSLS